MQSSGVITRMVLDKGYFFAEDDYDGQEVFCHHTEIDVVQINGHKCLYAVGVPIVYSLPERNRHVKQISLDPQYTIELPVIETSLLDSWQGSHGFLKRPCGCSLFKHEKGFKNHCDKYGSLHRRVRHGVANDGARCYVINAELVD